MRARVWIWTIGLAIVGYALAGRSTWQHPTAKVVGLVAGGAVGLVVGWSLQRLLDLGRRR